MSDDRDIVFDFAARKLIGQITPAFEVCDDPRTFGNEEMDRVVMDWFGYLEPYRPATDDWCSMPVRLVHHAAAGWHLEVGDVDLDAADIEALRKAIQAYDEAVRK